MPSEQPLGLAGTVICFMRPSSGAKSSTVERMPVGISPWRRRASNLAWSTRISPFARSQVMREPCATKNSTSFSRSVMSGTFSRRTGSPASSVAHRMGSAAFLLPDGVMVPERGVPPLTMRSAMKRREAEGCGRKGPGEK